MKIIRAVNNIPIEIELTPPEELELFEEMYLKRITGNLLWILEESADLDEPDNDHPFSATNILRALRRTPELAKIVARKFEANRCELYDGAEELDCAIEAYKDIVLGREVNK